jgi:NH3-dependent NAD+ synthetase
VIIDDDEERRYRLVRALRDIVQTIISPELLPAGADGEIKQSTEDKIGPYELHDFFLVNFVRNGFSPAKILFLSDHARVQQGHILGNSVSKLSRCLSSDSSHNNSSEAACRTAQR